MVLCGVVPASASPPGERRPAPSAHQRVAAVVALFDTAEAALAARRAALVLPGALQSRVSTAPRPGAPAAAGDSEEYFEIDDVFDVPSSFVVPDSVSADLADLLPAGRMSLLLAASSAPACPVDGSSFSDTWGAPRPFGRSHQGTDMLAAAGAPVVAVADGWVSRVDLVDQWAPGTDRDPGGITVSYTTMWGDRFYNAHLLSVPSNITPGVRISKGAIIGFVGASGNAKMSVSHLHIEWHPGGGQAVNPYPLLADACRRR
jgi:murein DD-endopeptidase MepM/ murein hydrolase activator NlpD